MHDLGLGAVWVCEILKSAEEVRELVALPATLELMAVAAVGTPRRTSKGVDAAFFGSASRILEISTTILNFCH